MHWRPWIEEAANKVLSRKGSQTPGVDGQTKRTFKEHYETNIAELLKELKQGQFTPLPVRRVYIPKSNGQKRPLGIATLKDRIVQEAMRAILDPILRYYQKLWIGE
jgi:retron-type reverse transcriptase